MGRGGTKGFVNKKNDNDLVLSRNQITMAHIGCDSFILQNISGARKILFQTRNNLFTKKYVGISDF